MDILIDLKNYNTKTSVFKRTAVRAIICDGEKYLFICSRYGDVKFPGGGVEKGEQLEEALLREVQEETGYQVDRATIRKYGRVLERRKGEYEDILEMESLYYYCEVKSEIGKRNLDTYEEEYRYEAVWLTLQEAIEMNKKMKDLERCPWVTRETQVMERLREEKIFFNDILSCIPDIMKEMIEGYSFEVESIGCSGAHIYIFENDLVLKVEQKKSSSDEEYQMLQWLQGKLPVPDIKYFHTGGTFNYLLMTRLHGRMACDPDIMSDLEHMARALAKGLKQLWQVDITGCPRIVNLDYQLSKALSRVENNLIDMEQVEPDTFGDNGFSNPMKLYEYLRDNRPEKEKAFVHGDYCLPNVFIENNEVSGYLDIGNSGVGDRWQDIALAVRSMRYNLELIGKEEAYPSLYQIFFEELGIEPDDKKIRYYILLDELF